MNNSQAWLSRVAAVGVLAFGVSGCVSTGVSAVADGMSGVGAFVTGSPQGAPHPIQIFVASTRKGPLNASDEASPDGQAHFSLATVSVPPGHEPGIVERPSFGSANRARDFVATSRRSLDDDGFKEEVASHVSGRIGSNRDILLFVHGFNNGYDEARFRLTQVAYDGRFGGVPVLFTWASKNSLFAYGSDRETAAASRDALEKLMYTLASVPGVGKVHILAHSMGAWLAMEALRQNAIAGHPDLDGHLGEVMLASPDIDLNVFRQQVARLGEQAHISVFAAHNDRALSLSSALANDRQRVGALDPTKPDDKAAIEQLGVKVYDTSRDSTDFIGHANYANAPDIVQSIGAQLGATRKEDQDTVAVIDADGHTAVSQPAAPVLATTTAVTASPLPEAGAAVIH
ncbi:alpha/beta fold hydrolase [Lichenihabitans sp. Uapishka_5]|uniref:alpha/beta hydrolase n=1 Tax=Lichenihabitans sp. Uapishka_5 TaxID=3037302 RepID=UPI0029E7CC34|nr:alpha/beta fold hydrolase [Lichenihabitans sp. Uapishka_5]MDX7951586.1 alpha/beta fold hydrolase [Lichenihabitans sp. Uapishka_5]